MLPEPRCPAQPVVHIVPAGSSVIALLFLGAAYLRKQLGKRKGKAGDDNLSVEHAITAQNCRCAVAGMPYIDLSSFRPHDPYQGRPSAEVARYFRGHLWPVLCG